jgi:hypothetical protein
MTLEQAQAALILAQQEVVDAAAALESTSAAVTSAGVVRDTAQTSYSEALAAWFASKVTIPGTTSMASQNVVLNGTFDDASNWSNISMGSNDTILNSNIPRVYNGVLIGSYVYHFVYQTGNFPSPTRQVTFSYDMSNNNFNDGNRPQVDGYRVEFRTYNAAGQVLNYYDTRNRADSFPWTHFTATYNLSDDAVRWDVGFRTVDNGYWNGNFAGSIDNVSVITQVATTSPETYTYGADETVAKDSTYQALQSARASLSSAVAAKTAAETRLATANAEVIRLTLLVAELTPHLKAPTNLVANIVGSNVELSWTAPQSSLSGVQVERYAIMWSTTSFVENGWAWAHDQTSVSIPLEVLNSAGGLGNTFQFAIRADNDTLSIYSSKSTYASVSTIAPPWWQISFDENQTVSIAAPQGYIFDTPRAWYGDPNGNCGLDVSSSVSAFITNNSSSSFVANNENFTDPCPGIGKVLRLSTPVKTIPVVAPTPSPTPTTSPQPSPTPQPEPTPIIIETPVIIIPEPEVIPEPVITPTPMPTEEPSIEPTPEPTVDPTPTPTPTEEPTPTPTPSEEPTPEPTENVVEPLPEPEPSTTPEIQPEPELPVTEEAAAEEIANLIEDVRPEDLTDAQVEQLVEAALVVFETAEQGSPAYEQALEALAVAAEADDAELPEELAAIPLLGDVAGAALEVFNNIGNVGADMAPSVREEAEKTVIASVIATGAAVNAVAAAATAASTTTSTGSGSSGSSGGASAGSSSGARRKEE